MPCRCYIVPPHLLRAIAESTANSDKVRQSARNSLAAHEHLTAARKDRLAASGRPGFTRTNNSSLGHSSRPGGIIPPYLLEGIEKSENNSEGIRANAKRALEHYEHLKGLGTKQQAADQDQDQDQDHGREDHPSRAVHDAKHDSDEDALPGKLIRSEGQEADVTSDKAVNEAFDNVGIVLTFYKEKFKWNSIDNKNMDVISSVHFGQEYENAFWDPQKEQMVFGDGDEFLNNFTGCIDVIGHELTHAVTENTSPLDYFGQPGALNEHVSDIFGIMIKQQVQNEKSDVADWLIGEDCICPGVKGIALRSMKEPGTAYNDQRFGKDPQVGNMSGFKATSQDNGGVHIFSGIPNKAFYLAAVAFGGYSWEKAGQIWWKTLNSGRIPAKCSFKQFADVTIDVAEEEFDKDAGNVVRKAWAQVGIVIKV